MSRSRVPEELPEAYRGREQTFVKHLVLRSYLELVAYNILSFRDEFVFVDGFSGPWKARTASYADTSFGIAIEKLRSVRDDFLGRFKSKRLRCIFVEKGRGAFKKLSAAAAGAPDLQAQAIHGRFEDKVDEVRKLVGPSFALTFVDPTGWSFDLAKLAPLLRQDGEVLVNFMYEHFRRFIDDERPDIRSSQNKPFGDANWRDHFEQLRREGLSKEEAVLELFKRQLKSIGKFKYVASARVQHRLVNRSHFYLVYGTRHEKGLVVFRDVEKKAQLAEEHYRIEARQEKQVDRTGQLPLLPATVACPPASEGELRLPELRRAREWLLRSLGELPVMTFDAALPAVLERFSVTYSELRTLFEDLGKEGLVEFDGMKPRQRKPDKGVTVRARAAAA
jgi:three-Cys-motif partner protein